MSFKDMTRGIRGGNTAGLLAGGTGSSVFSDDTNLARQVGVLLGESGDLKILDCEDVETTFAAGELAVGVFHPIRAKRIFATGTSAGLQADNKLKVFYFY